MLLVGKAGWSGKLCRELRPLGVSGVVAIRIEDLKTIL
jgi:hypothetical protein